MEERSFTHGISYPPPYFSASVDPRDTRESEGLCSSAGSRGWPLVSAKRANTPSAEGWREFQREEGNASHCMVPFLSLSIRELLLPSRLATLEPRGVH